jgi:protein phosphatase
MVNGGLLTPEDARTHKRRNVVTNVLGGPNPGVHAEIHKVPLEDGDVLLLCSDGLTEVVPDEAIARTLIEASSPTEASRLLVNQAREAGGPDNITTILARYRITPPEGLTIPTGL